MRPPKVKELTVASEYTAGHGLQDNQGGVSPKLPRLSHRPGSYWRRCRGLSLEARDTPARAARVEAVLACSTNPSVQASREPLRSAGKDGEQFQPRVFPPPDSAEQAAVAQAL